jgi:hypothetical protein
MEPDEAGQRSNVMPVIVIGIILGVVTCAFGFVVTGAGHGLYTALYTFFSLMLAPAAFVAVRYRRQRSAKIVMLIVAAIGIGVDVAICIEGIQEQMFARVWKAIPVSFAIWITCWLSWQFVLLAAMRRSAPKVANE